MKLGGSVSVSERDLTQIEGIRADYPAGLSVSVIQKQEKKTRW
jgi:hypothetical protein